jgi:hypothetical protein
LSLTALGAAHAPRAEPALIPELTSFGQGRAALLVVGGVVVLGSLAVRQARQVSTSLASEAGDARGGVLWPGAKLISSHPGVGARLARLLDASGIPR